MQRNGHTGTTTPAMLDAAGLALAFLNQWLPLPPDQGCEPGPCCCRPYHGTPCRLQPPSRLWFCACLGFSHPVALPFSTVQRVRMCTICTTQITCPFFIQGRRWTGHTWGTGVASVSVSPGRGWSRSSSTWGCPGEYRSSLLLHVTPSSLVYPSCRCANADPVRLFDVKSIPTEKGAQLLLALFASDPAHAQTQAHQQANPCLHQPPADPAYTRPPHHHSPHHRYLTCRACAATSGQVIIRDLGAPSPQLTTTPHPARFQTSSSLLYLFFISLCLSRSVFASVVRSGSFTRLHLTEYIRHVFRKDFRSRCPRSRGICCSHLRQQTHTHSPQHRMYVGSDAHAWRLLTWTQLPISLLPPPTWSSRRLPSGTASRTTAARPSPPHYR